jgi:hypothetical protein
LINIGTPLSPSLALCKHVPHSSWSAAFASLACSLACPWRAMVPEEPRPQLASLAQRPHRGQESAPEQHSGAHRGTHREYTVSPHGRWLCAHDCPLAQFG